MNAVFWALLCLFLAAINDMLFKLFKKQRQSTGIFISVIGLVWMMISLLGGHGLGPNPTATLIWGTVSGIFSVVGNIMLISSMKYQSVGISSTVYRLNLVAVVVGGWFLFGEMLSHLQIIGIFVALCAVMLFFPWAEHGDKRTGKYARYGLLISIIAALMRSGMGLSYKEGALSGAAIDGIILINSICWFIGGIVWYWTSERKKEFLNRQVLGYGVISGIFVFGICYTMAVSISKGNLSIVLPIAQMSFVVTFLLGAVILHEKMSWEKITGACCGIVGILLLAA